MVSPTESPFTSGGLVHTFVSSSYLGIFFYGLLLVGVNILLTSLTITLVLLGLLTLIINYFKIPTSSQEQVNSVFGVDPLTRLGEVHNDCQSADQSHNEGILTNGVELLRNLESESQDSRGLNGDHHLKSRLVTLKTSGSPILIVGHRGSGLDAPENSLSAFRQCKARGCDVVEFDVSLTKDNVPVIFHDDDLTRICGIDRKINDVEWSELKTLDISILHPLGEKFREERIPTFDEAVEVLIQLNMKFIIDLKDSDEHVVNAVCQAFAKHPQLYRQAVVSSFIARVVYDIRRRDPKIIGCMAWRPHSWRFKCWSVDGINGQGLEQRYQFFAYDWLAILGDICMDWLLPNFLWWFLGLGVILLQKDSASKHDIMQWTRNGVRVLLWTVNSPVEKLHLSQVVQVGYLTDTLDGVVLS